MSDTEPNPLPLDYSSERSRPTWKRILDALTRAGVFRFAIYFFPVVAIVVAFSLTRLASDQKRPHNITHPTTDISNISTAVKKFELENDRYPTTQEGLQALITNPGNLPNWTKCLDGNSMPLDYWGHPYIYVYPGSNGNDFDLYSAGPDGIPGTADDIFYGTQ